MYKICSHTVVAAESNGKLREFISWYKRNKSINLDALSKHGLGKGAGKKGGKAKQPRKPAKQDSAIAVKQVDGLKGMMSNTTNLYSSASEPGPSHVLTSECLCITVYVLPSTCQWASPITSLPTELLCLTVRPSIYVLNWWWAWSMLTCCLHVTLPISCSSTEHLHEPLLQPIVPGTTPTPSYAPVHSPVKPFTLKLLNGHIKVCAGCRNGFRNPDGSLPGAPYDICICHEESREIIRPKTKQPATVWKKVH